MSRKELAQDAVEGYWGYVQVASYLKVTTATLRSYRTEGRMPEPDKMVLGRPFWRPKTIVTWSKERPGRGNWGRREAS